VLVYTHLHSRRVGCVDVILAKDIQRYSIGEDTLTLKAEDGHIAVVSEITHRDNLLRKVKTYSDSTRTMVEYIDLMLG
jgi:hypothetical protein